METSEPSTPTVLFPEPPKRPRWMLWTASVILLALAAFGFWAKFLSTPTFDEIPDDMPSVVFENFDTCAEDGNPIMESFPAQCKSASGAHFVDDLGIFTDTGFGIAIAYPVGYRFTEGSDPEFTVGTFFGSPAPTLASVAMEPEMFRGTNARHAFVTWSAISGISSDQCAMFAREGEEGGTTMIGGPTINGVPFLEGRSDGAAAGTRVASRILHAELHERCYEIGMHLVTSNIGNFEPGTVREADEMRLFALLERVAMRTAFAQE